MRKAAGRADAKGINRLSNRLSIKWNQDKRNCTSIWKTENESAENIIMKGKLCDMPTIVETYKTTDKKTFYKSGTIRLDLKLRFTTSDWTIPPSVFKSCQVK